MSDQQDVVPQFNVGDRVWLLLRPEARTPKCRHDGTVIAVDDVNADGRIIRGVRIQLDQPAPTGTCYATHRETHHVE